MDKLCKLTRQSMFEECSTQSADFVIYFVRIRSTYPGIEQNQIGLESAFKARFCISILKI